MSFVIDASATMPWCFPEEATRESEDLLNRLASADAHAPALWTLQVMNVLGIAERKGRIPYSTSDAFIARLRRMRIKLDHDFEDRAFFAIKDLVRKFNLSSYDAAYLELAIRLHLPLASRDEALKRAALQSGVAVLDT